MKERQSSALIAAAAPEDRAALQDALSRDPAIHYAVIEAESGLRALEPLRARRPDCLILDHDLPDLSAFHESTEAQLRAILDYSTAVVFIKDLEGRYLRINHRYERMPS